MSLVLGVDASEYTLELGLINEQGETFACAHHDRDIAENFLPLLDELLKSAGAEREEIKVCALNHGPGSYTGIRSSLSFASALALNPSCKLWCASGLLTRMLTQKDIDRREMILALLTANASEYYYALFLPGSIRESKYALFSQLKVVYTAHAEETWFLVGSSGVLKKDDDALIAESLAGVLAADSLGGTLGIERIRPVHLDRAELAMNSGLIMAQAYCGQADPGLGGDNELILVGWVVPLYIKPVNALTIEQRKNLAKV